MDLNGTEKNIVNAELSFYNELITGAFSVCNALKVNVAACPNLQDKQACKL